jgi:ABC-type nitrate/sulfonate/bicarbonate transport system substrate-binding protein
MSFKPPKLIFLLLYVCTYSLFAQSLNNKELEKVSIQLKWHNQFQFAGYYVAKYKGYYEQAGLDVELIDCG